jgi:hypothetical protein
VNAVFLRKSFNQIMFMFINSPDEVRRYANIKSSISLTGHDINIRILDFFDM